MAEDAAVAGVGSHRFRYTAITKMAKENVHVSVAQRIASHRNVRTTLAIYPHVTDDDLMKAAEGLNRPARAKSQS